MHKILCTRSIWSWAIVLAMASLLVACNSPTNPQPPAPNDTTVPTLTSLSAPSSILDNAALPISVSVSDAGGGDLTVLLYNGATALCSLQKQSASLYSCSYSGLASATYGSLSLKVSDAAGNTSSLPLPSLRVKSTDACLGSLTSSVGSISPAFNPNTVSYGLSVPNRSAVTFTGIPRSPTATKVGAQSGTNPWFITYVVTAEAGAPYTKSYVVMVTAY